MKIISLIISLCMLVIYMLYGCNMANAENISMKQAFSALLTSGNALSHHVQVHGLMIANGKQLSKPKFLQNHFVNLASKGNRASCNEIDLYTGSLSYISGEEFVHLLKSIAANTMGYNFSLSMRTLCPVCASTIASLQKIEQSENQFAIHQCQLGMGISHPMQAEQLQTHTKVVEAIEAAHQGKVSDFIAGMYKIQNHIDQTIDLFVQRVNAMKSQAEQDQAVQSSPYGSQIWKMLRGLGVYQKVFIQSILGSLTRYPSPSIHANAMRVERFSPSLSVESMVDLFMYGVKSKHPDNSRLKLISCDRDQGNIFFNKGIRICAHLIKKPIQYSNWYLKDHLKLGGISLKDYGFFGLTYTLLFQALEDIKDQQSLGQPKSIVLPESIYGNSVKIMASFHQSEIKSFIENIYLPIYSAMKLVVSEPQTAYILIKGVAELIATEYAVTFINQQIFDISEVNHNNDVDESINQLHNMLAILKNRLEMEVRMAWERLHAMQSWVSQLHHVYGKIMTQQAIDFSFGGG